MSFWVLSIKFWALALPFEQIQKIQNNFGLNSENSECYKELNAELKCGWKCAQVFSFLVFRVVVSSEKGLELLGLWDFRMV